MEATSTTTATISPDKEEFEEGSIISSTDIDAVKNSIDKDGKRPNVVSTPTFLLTALVGVPIFATVVAPLTLVYQAGKMIIPSGEKKTKENVDAKEKNASMVVTDHGEIFPDISDLVPFQDRKYDVVILGSTGFTGSLAANYIAENYGVNKSVKWAIAGRSPQKLQKVKSQLMEKHSITDIDIIIADTNKPSTLHNLVKDTRVVLSTAGPFSRYGSNVVEFCAKYGTSYVDTTGEAEWNKEMQMTWGDYATQTGSKIVSLCGYDSVPFDLTVHKLTELLKKECNEDVVLTKCYVEAKGAASGGTLQTMFDGMEGVYKAPRYEYDPYLKKSNGKKSSNKIKPNHPMFFQKDEETGQWVSPHVMSLVNTETVKRTHALKGKEDNDGSNMEYQESAINRSFEDAFVSWFGLVFFFTALANPVTGTVLKKFLPKPGEGPTPNQMKYGYYLVTAVGEGANGSKVESAFYAPGDPGYKDTSRMVAESALSIALEADKLPVQGGGFYSPAVGLGDVLLERLCKTGTKFASRVIVRDGKIQSKL